MLGLPGLFQKFLNLFLIPLSFLPPFVKLFLMVVISFFSLFLTGKMLRWLWDALPIA